MRVVEQYEGRLPVTIEISQGIEPAAFLPWTVDVHSAPSSLLEQLPSSLGITFDDLAAPFDAVLGSNGSVAYVYRAWMPADEDLTRIKRVISDYTGGRGVVRHDPVGTSSCCGQRAVKVSSVGNAIGVLGLRAFVGFDRMTDMRGENVYLAVVDIGINIEYVNRRLTQIEGTLVSVPTQDTPSFVPPTKPNVDLGVRPFQAPLFDADGKEMDPHGTKMAINAALIAPKATLIDLAAIRDDVFIQQNNMTNGRLSHVARCYELLVNFARDLKSTKGTVRLVVNNSWFLDESRPEWVAEFGRADSTLNTRIEELDELGADIVFSAGNCGPGGKSSNCLHKDDDSGPTQYTHGIHGSNSHPSVLCVSAGNGDRKWLRFSSSGPGQMYRQKPDTTVYSLVKGYRDNPPRCPDGGTSTATAVASGIIAAIRSKYPPETVSPGRLRQLIRQCSSVRDDVPSCKWDRRFGYGFLDVPALCRELEATTTIA